MQWLILIGFRNIVVQRFLCRPQSTMYDVCNTQDFALGNAQLFCQCLYNYNPSCNVNVQMRVGIVMIHITGSMWAFHILPPKLYTS